MVYKYRKFSSLETTRKFGIAKLLIRELESLSFNMCIIAA